MGVDSVPDGDNILRALKDSQYDPRTTDVAPSCLTDESISVNHIGSVPIDEHFRIFKRVLKQGEIYNAAIEINVGRLRRLAAEYTPKPTTLNVVMDPKDDNPHHALILGKITRGIANLLIKERVGIHTVPY
jgi:hypothetical protein